MIDDDDDKDFSQIEDEESDNTPFRQFGDLGSTQPEPPAPEAVTAPETDPAAVSPAPAPGPKSPPRPKKDRPVG